MSTTSCYQRKCNREVEVSCNCTSPETLSCKKHCKSSSSPHNITPMFLESIKGTKEGILSLLNKKQTKIFAIKTKMLDSFYQTFCGYKNIFEETLKEIDTASRKMSNYYDKVYRVKKISSLEKDPVLCLLTLQKSEAVEKVKSIFEYSKNIELFYEINSQIDKITKNFTKEKSKIMQKDIISKLISTEDLKNRMEWHNAADFERYVSAIKKDPNNADAFSNIGTIFYAEKEYKKAMKCYNYAIKINPRCSNYYTNKGNALREIGRREKSLECFNEAIRINPHNSDAYHYIGDLSYDENKYEEAIKYYNSAIRIDPNKAIYYINKGMALEFSNKTEKAVKFYKKGIKRDRYNYCAYYRLGMIFLDKNQYEEAIQYLNETIKSNSNSASSYWHKGFALKQLGRIEEAVECYKIVIQFPHSYDVDATYNSIGNLYYDVKQYKEAIKYYNDAIKKNPTKAMYYIKKGKALKKLGKSKKAVKFVKEIFKFDPNNDAAYNIIGDFFYEDDRYKEALQYYDEAIRINPKKAIYYTNKENTLQKLDRVKEEVKCFNEVVNLDGT